jgi:hypothetical protein
MFLRRFSYSPLQSLRPRHVSAALLASGVLSLTLQAQVPYQDPNGNFSVRVVAGWQAQPQSGSPMVSFVNEPKQASLSFGVMRGPQTQTPSVDDEMKRVQAQFPQQCPGTKVLGQGPMTLGGESGKFVKVNCSDGKGGFETMEIAVAAGPGNMIILNSAAPAQNAASVEPAFRAMQASFRLAPGGGAQPAAEPAPAMDGRGGGQMGGGMGGQMGGGGNTFRDPMGRYSFGVPQGWNVKSDNGTTTVSSGDSWATFIAGNGDSPGPVAQNLSQQITSQYKQVQVLNQGDTQVNNHPAHGINLTGIDPKGARVSVLVVSIDAGSGHILTVISSAPNQQAQQINGMIMNMVNSVRFAGE